MNVPDSSPILEARGVSRREPNGDRWLLQDVCLKINGGCRLALVGPTGSGKTVLLRALSRLDVIDSGTILWHGNPVSGDAIPAFRRQTIYLQQQPALIEGTVEDNLRLPFTFAGQRDREYSKATIQSLLDQVNRSADLLPQSARDLSGGEKQIVALLRAIQLQPTMLMLDEPTASLDDESMRMIEQLVNNWFDQSPLDRAFVWVSHNKDQVARIANRIVTIDAGRLANDEQSSGTQSP